ncbi:hypothetical protein [Microbulbifer sp. JMSA002]|uniref:hypothetical protein n=1 Tax=Microbulbifer sp. JMSA002 TaxID=3243368 RepID=UPI0040397A5A
MQKLLPKLLAVTLVIGITGCSTTKSQGTPKSLSLNGKKFHCVEQELETKTLVRCARSG